MNKRITWRFLSVFNLQCHFQWPSLFISVFAWWISTRRWEKVELCLLQVQEMFVCAAAVCVSVGTLFSTVRIDWGEISKMDWPCSGINEKECFVVRTSCLRCHFQHTPRSPWELVFFGFPATFSLNAGAARIPKPTRGPDLESSQQACCFSVGIKGRDERM